MRAAVGILSLLLALAVIGLLVKKQLSSTRNMVPVLQPTVGGPSASDTATPAPTVRAQSQQVQQQYQQAVEGLMQPRAMPDADQ